MLYTSVTSLTQMEMFSELSGPQVHLREKVGCQMWVLAVGLLSVFDFNALQTGWISFRLPAASR